MHDPLPLGSRAPEFALEGSDGRLHRLGEELQDATVLLIFYPGNNTPG